MKIFDICNTNNKYMTTKKRYSASETCVYNLGFHLIWCTKYRRKVLTPEIESRLKELIREKADELEVEIVEMETMPDHIHIFVKSKPTYAPHFLVQQFKRYSSRVLREEFAELRSRLPSLWTRSYFCESVGCISADTIIRYIENQKKH